MFNALRIPLRVAAAYSKSIREIAIVPRRNINLARYRIISTVTNTGWKNEIFSERYVWSVESVKNRECWDTKEKGGGEEREKKEKEREETEDEIEEAW